MFENRQAAGRVLAQALLEQHYSNVVVMGLPRGGVPVAEVVAQRLKVPLDVLVAHKISVPFQPELAMGAVAEDGTLVWDPWIARNLELPKQVLDQATASEMAAVRRRQAAFRQGRAAPDMKGRTAILVDDGLATGCTMEAAVLMAQKAGAAKVVVAAPVGSQEAVRRLRDQGAEVVCLLVPPDLMAIGGYYADFTQVSDQEVKACLLHRPAVEQAPVETVEEHVAIPFGRVALRGDLCLPGGATAIVVFAHGSGSSRFSPRNRFVARALQAEGLGTLLLDLFTPEEEEVDTHTRALRFDIPMLAERLVAVAQWLQQQPRTQRLVLGYFGASTGAAAALMAAARHPQGVGAVVSRGGRPDLAGPWLSEVQAPTLLIVGSRDEEVIQLNRTARAEMQAACHLEIVPGATHLFEEPGTLEQVAALACNWFTANLRQHGRVGSV